MVAPVVVAAGISAAGSLLGGLFGGKKKQTTERTLNFQKIRDDGVKAGFNPLTALQAAAGAGVGTSTTTGPQLSTPEILANAVVNGAQAYADSWFNQAEDAKDQEIERIKLETMKAELANVQARTSYLNAQKPFGSTIPVYDPAPVTGRVHTRAAPLSTVPNGQWEAPELRRVESVPLTAEFRTGRAGDPPYRSLNPDAFEIGVGELIGGGLVHGGAYLLNQSRKSPKAVKDAAKGFLSMEDWLNSKARDAYRYFAKPGRKSVPGFGPGITFYQ